MDCPAAALAAEPAWAGKDGWYLPAAQTDAGSLGFLFFFEQALYSRSSLLFQHRGWYLPVLDFQAGPCSASDAPELSEQRRSVVSGVAAGFLGLQLAALFFGILLRLSSAQGFSLCIHPARKSVVISSVGSNSCRSFH